MVCKLKREFVGVVGQAGRYDRVYHLGSWDLLIMRRLQWPWAIQLRPVSVSECGGLSLGLNLCLCLPGASLQPVHYFGCFRARLQHPSMSHEYHEKSDVVANPGVVYHWLHSVSLHINIMLSLCAV